MAPDWYRVEAEHDELERPEETCGLDMVGNREPLTIHEKRRDGREWCCKVASARGMQATGRGCELLAPPLLGRAGQ